MEKLLLYLAAFLTHWLPLVTAGGLFGLQEALDRYWKWASDRLASLPSAWRTGMNIGTLTIAFLVSGYFAWSDEHDLRVAAITERDKAVNALERAQDRNYSRTEITDVNKKSEIVIVKFGLARPNQNDSYYLNYFYMNMGNVIAGDPSWAYHVAIMDHEPTNIEADNMKSSATSILNRQSLPAEIQNVFRPNSQKFNTLWGRPFSQVEINDVQNGRKNLVFLMMMKYVDETSGSDKYRISVFCGYFTNTFEHWKECYAYNRSYTETR